MGMTCAEWYVWHVMVSSIDDANTFPCANRLEYRYPPALRTCLFPVSLLLLAAMLGSMNVTFELCPISITMCTTG